MESLRRWKERINKRRRSGTDPSSGVFPAKDNVNVEGIYQNLDPELNQIRLMRMPFSEANDDKIECELGTFPINDRPEHVALSYCWTKKPAIHTIRLNGRPFMVRPNLYQYLKLMKEERHTCWIFIDALCINQNDLVERGQQVRLMGQIYEHAEEVVAWMGARGEGFGEPFIRAFLRREYWSRLWIVQEITLAHKLTFRSGRLCIGLEEFQINADKHARLKGLNLRKMTDQPGNMAHSLKERKSEYNTLVLASTLLARRQEMQIGVRGVHRMHLLLAVSGYSMQGCTVSYDRIFGILGLTNSQREADYEMPALDLYLRVLVEGILEYNLAEDVDSADVETRARQPIEESFFCSTLMSALDLHPHNPVVFLITQAALAGCDQLLKRPITTSNSHMYQISYKFLLWKHHYFGGRPFHLGAIISVRLRIVMIRVQLRRWTKRTLTSPCDKTDSRTFERWLQMVMEVFKAMESDVSAILRRRVEYILDQMEEQNVMLKSLAIELNILSRETTFFTTMDNLITSAKEIYSNNESIIRENPLEFIEALAGGVAAMSRMEAHWKAEAPPLPEDE